ncbi:FmdE family protein [Methanobacterium oryzae]|uniref:FmdE family protein n=1 Tax=Methanobacterium oryzae TaxID=69540 RepID=UPI003D206E78
MSENSELNIKPYSDVTEFHGHVCPGSAMGYKAAEIAIKELSSKKAVDEELVCITENDTCAVDAIQVVTGCTFGKGNLIFYDYGKQAYTFINRETEDAVRVSLKNTFNVANIDPELSKLRQKVKAGESSEEEKVELGKRLNIISEAIINLPDDEIFNIEHIKEKIPDKASIFKSIKCQNCGEMVSEHRIKLKNGKNLCIPCFNEK